MLTNRPVSKEVKSGWQHPRNKLHKNVTITILRLTTIYGLPTQDIAVSIVAAGDTIIELNDRKVRIVAGEIKRLLKKVT